MLSRAVNLTLGKGGWGRVTEFRKSSIGSGVFSSVEQR